MRLLHLLSILTSIAFLAPSSPAWTQTRVALVIANGAYQSAPYLPQPPRDAAAVAAALEHTGFTTITRTDLTQSDIATTLEDFARSTRDADIALFYYSGHALRFDGRNYLAGVDTVLHDETDVPRMIRVDPIVAALTRARKLGILVLESCRGTPLVEALRRPIGSARALPLGAGLAEIAAPDGMIVATAEKTGDCAADAGDRHSLFTAAFLRHIGEPDDISDIFRSIRDDVSETAQHAQRSELSVAAHFDFNDNRVSTPENSTAPETLPDPVLPDAIGSARLRQTALAGDPEAPATADLPDAIGDEDGEPPGFSVPATADLPDAIGGLKLRSAACAGDPAAAYEVGLRFAQGRGVSVNYPEAVWWFSRAELAGLAPAALKLGVLYERGQGVGKDLEQARLYFLKAAEGGNAAAMHNLGVLEAERGNHVSAAQWFARAARHGVTDSQFNLAVLYYRGDGVVPDLQESYKWFSLAAARGDREAMDRRNNVVLQLSDVALASAEQAIRYFVVEPQPDEAFHVPGPPGGWD
ncbi:MAG: caspase family protein [Alphaproteobacteria bacterium]|nr:caspase family protein [Alphaproteobacteria bacterium]